MLSKPTLGKRDIADRSVHEREAGAGVVKEEQKENPTVRQDKANRLVCAIPKIIQSH